MKCYWESLVEGVAEMTFSFANVQLATSPGCNWIHGGASNHACLKKNILEWINLSPFSWKWLHRILESWMPHQLHIHTWEKCYGTGLCTIYYEISLGGWFSAGGPSINQPTRKGCHYNCEACLGWLYHMGMDQYLLIPFLVGWTSMNPSYFDVNYRGTRFWHTAI